ncbi:MULTISPECIES: RimK family alpha-L-glutamate ligase [unclassified Planococcus (in: firmicutes)]|uniref:ATP-grasp domain-containing protein n=1 Tax=unclassified Planococcus (in: firmicutes) TaxID=2662419 RepID=UPI000C7A2312|nr:MULTISPECIES: RimK family alpha-L-glutamate ligase [unclassified Planococcus (in: firmicutes)]PKG45869.1 RimK family alpha-L-glutamate ligase [Planococcus sp. Urea-trap-24]PKG88422.1 RimK family alpha-L-glutamate ligase [Planococcus sp. Urea-3u-39]PKH38860.1 RimK family alpha-L-glutamate ligase [Planococcus sp. MB-3u-09]
MLSCWVIYNGSLVSDKFQDQAQLMAEAAERQGIQVSIMKNYEIQMSLSEQQIFPDFAVLLDKDILLGYFLKSRGVPVYNDPAIIDLCDNKATQYIRLSERKIPMPKTIVAPKVYPNFTIQGSGYYEGVLDQLGLPMIIKEGHGSFGMKVYLIETEGQFYEKVESLSGIDYVFQEFIAESRGRDIRVNIVGEKIVAAMKRQSDTDFRANITNGGRAFPVELTPQQEQLALDAAQAVGAVFAGVDLLYGPDGQTLVCEVNAAAHIRNILNVTGVNVADAMMRYIQEDLA